MAEDPEPRQAPRAQDTDRVEVAAYAHEALAAGDYRAAIRYYRSLAHTEPPAAWAKGLEQAYRGRALELEAKGMPQEALAIWESRRWRCPGTLPTPEQIRLQLRLDAVEAALAGYHELLTAEAQAALREVRPWLAARCLADPALLTAFATDDPVRSHGEHAQAALTAYCTGASEQAWAHLRRIPYRSPYRDLAILLKALLVQRQDPAVTMRLLARIDPTSPFARLAAAARLALQPEGDFVQALRTADEPSQRFAMALRGWPKARAELWRQLFGTDEEEDTPVEAQLNLLLEGSQQLDERWRRQQLIRYAYSYLQEPVDRALEAQLSEPERALLAAWQTERSHPEVPEAVHNAWQQVIESLRAPGEPSPGSRDALRIAIIQRHLASTLQQLAPEQDAAIERALADSVALDPGYRPGHRMLIAHYRRQGRLEQASLAAERALARWPASPELLQEALETALATSALETAAAYAQRLLSQDPLNRRARTALHGAFLAHARHHAATGAIEEATRRLDDAVRWADSPRAQAQVELTRDTLAVSQTRGSQQVRALAERHGGGLTGSLAVAMEAERLGLGAQRLLEQGRLPQPAQDPRQDLLHLCTALQEIADDEPDERLGRALTPLRRGLKRMIRLRTLGVEDYAAICEALRAVHEHPLREAFAREASRHRLEDPRFIFHALEARHAPGSGRRPSSRELDQLQRAFRRARAMDDKRTAHRLGALIKRLVPEPGGS
ncbi:MAG: hypothetical protein ACLFSI_02100 [Halorhodospira sp.]